MAKKIAGITVEIGGDTTKLGKALADVNGKTRDLQTELRGVESLLKLDPSNIVLLEQKQEILNETIAETRTKLNTLKDVQAQVQAQFEKGDITVQQYRDFQREIVQTENKLKKLENQAVEFGTEMRENAQRAENALNQVGDSANKAGTDLEKMGQKLDANNMLEAAEAISGMADKLIELGTSAFNSAVEFQNAQTTMRANLDLTAEEAEALNETVQNVFTRGVVGSIEEATQAVTIVKASFEDLNGVELENLTNTLIGISERTGTDIVENTRAAEKLMQSFGISGTEATDIIASGFQNNLNISGDFLDTLNEYAPHFESAGYSANDMLEILKSGMENGALNTDKAADAVKELQIRLGDGSMDKVIEEFSTGTQDMFQKWKDGEVTVKDVAASISADLASMTPTEQQEALSLLSTQFEDLGVDAANALFEVGTSFDDVTGKANVFAEVSPGEEFEASLRNLQTSLIPIGEQIAAALKPVLDALAQLAEWFGSLPAPIQVFVAVFGGIIAIAAVLAPLIIGLALAFMTLNISLLPIIAIVVGVAAVIAALVVVIMNWGTITDWLTEKWNQFTAWIVPIVQNACTAIAEWFQNAWLWIQNSWNGVVEWFQGIWNGIVTAFSNAGAWFSTLFTNAWNGIKTAWSAVTGWFSGIWNSIKGAFSSTASWFGSIFTNAWNNIKTAFSNVTGFFGGIYNTIVTKFKNIGVAIGNAISGAFKTAINGALATVESVINTGVGLINGAIGVINKLPGVSIGRVPEVGLPRLRTGGVLEEGQAMIAEAGSPEMVTMMNGKAVVTPLTQRNKTHMLDRQGGQNVYYDDNSVVAGKLDKLIGMWEEALPNLNPAYNVVMDTGAVVGQLAPKLDKRFGQDTGYRGRGR